MEARFIILLAFLLIPYAYAGMECKVKIGPLTTQTCPRIIDDPDETYCCLNSDYETYRCCDLEDFVKQQGYMWTNLRSQEIESHHSSSPLKEDNMGIVLILSILVPLIALVVCCLCCLCCPFCFIYKRRHRGAVYGRAGTGITTTTTTVHQTPGPPPSTVNPYPYYPPQPSMPPQYGAPQPYPAYPQPPPTGQAAQELYPRQAPYNPNFS